MDDDMRLQAAFGSAGGDQEAAWAGAVPGPDLGAVMRRLSSTPKPFLDEGADIRSLAGDLGIVTPLACLAHVAHERVRQGAAVGLWLLASEAVIGPLEPPLASGTPARMVDALALLLAPASAPLTWFAEGDRREEAARCALLWCGFLPRGEDEPVARAVWDGLDSAVRSRMAQLIAREEAHRAAVNRQLAAAAAREAAARYTRE